MQSFDEFKRACAVQGFGASSFNHDTHWQITKNNLASGMIFSVVDVWPSTNKWIPVGVSGKAKNGSPEQAIAYAVKNWFSQRPEKNTEEELDKSFSLDAFKAYAKAYIDLALSGSVDFDRGHVRIEINIPFPQGRLSCR